MSSAAEQQLQDQLVELERQITDEFDARAAIGDQLTRLEADNARLRSQVQPPRATASLSLSRRFVVDADPKCLLCSAGAIGQTLWLS